MPQFIRTGQTIPEITLPTLDGSPVSLTSFRGKKLLVFMWASW
jgi:peroxiredoxin